jgi:DNA-binding PadR family transcriptional regulator
MRFPDISPENAVWAEEQRQELLRKLGLVHLGRSKDSAWLVFKEGSESEILKSLLKLSCANIYRLSRATRDAGQYSTVLRALRRLEGKRLAQIATTIDEGRKQKKYCLTLLGELVASLAKGGWKLAAEKLAEHSSRFRELVTAHHSFEPDYYIFMTRDIIEGFNQFPRYKNVEPNVEELVTATESEWISRAIVENLHDPKERAEVFMEVKKVSQVGWIRPIVISLIDGFIREEKELLDELVHFKEALVSA